MKKNLLPWKMLVIVFFNFWAINSFAQVSNYTFAQNSGTYTPITGGTVSGSGTLDDNIYSVTLPTAFSYNGNSIATVGFSANGYLIMGGTTTHGYTPVSSTATSNGVIAALAADLNNVSGSTQMRWQQIGNEIIFQWASFRRYNLTGEDVSFQIRLNTATKGISIVYNGSSVVNSAVGTPQVGLRGSTNSDYNARRLTTSVPDATPAWNDTAAATSNAHNVRFTSTSIAAFPAAGQTFTWSAPVIAIDMASTAIVGIPTSGCANSSVPLSVTIKNNGANTIDFSTNNAAVSVAITGASTQTLSATVNSGTLASGASQTVMVSPNSNFSAGGTHNIAAAVTVTADGVGGNNTFSVSKVIAASTTAPYAESFTTTSTPTGWDTTGWTIATSHGVTTNGIYRNMYSFNNTGQFNTIVVGPISATSELKFDYRIVDYTSYPATATAADWGNFKVQISTDCGGTFTDLQTVNDANHVVSTNWATKTISLSPTYSGQSVQIRILATWAAGDYFLDFDNFSIAPATTCFTPTVTGTTPIATTTASINWTAPSPVPANGYNYEIRTSGAAGSGATGLTTSGSVAAGITTANIAGLNPATLYSVYVQSNCGVTGISSWSVGGMFTTACAVPNNPGAIAVSNYSSTGFTLTFAAASPAPNAYVLFYSNGVGSATATPPLVAGTNYVAGNIIVFGGVTYTCITNNSVSPIVLTGGTANTQFNYFLFSKSTTNACFGNPYYSTGVTVSPITCPAAVTAPVVSPLGTTTATVSWTASAGGTAATINYTLEVYANSNFTGAITGSPFNTGTAVTQNLTGLNAATTYYFRIKANNGSCDSTYLTGSFSTACVGAVVTATAGDRCGRGSVKLSAATDVAATVDWYSAATGGTSLFTGNIFNTPSISATTTYYAEASVSGGVPITGGKIAPDVSWSGSTLTDWGIIFSALKSLTVNSVDLYTSSTGTVNLKITNSSGTELFSTGNITLSNTGAASPNIIPLNFNLPIGADYKILVKSYSGINLLRGSPAGFPYSDANINVTASEWGGSTTTAYYYIYNIKTTSACVTSPRTQVTATVNPAPSAIAITEIPTSTGATTACDLDVVQLVASGGTISKSVFLENFDSTPSGVTSLPPGWSKTNASNVFRWGAGPYNDAGGSANEMRLLYNSNGTDGSGDWLLKSPGINSAGFINMKASFKYNLGFFSAGTFVLTLQTSPDQNTWTNQWSNTFTGVTGSEIFLNSPAATNIDLSSLNGISTFYLRFVLSGSSIPLSYFAMDDVAISGNVQQPITWSPAAGLFTDATLTTAYNAGDNALTVYAAPNAPQQYTATALPGICQAQKISTIIESSKKTFTGLATLVPDQVLWNVLENWSFKQVPTVTKCVVIPTGFNVQVNTPLAVAKNVTVDAGGKLTINAEQSLNVKETFTNKAGVSDVMIESDGNLIQKDDVANLGLISAKRLVTVKDNTQYNYLISPLVGKNLRTNIYEGTTSAALTLYHNEANNKFYTSSGAYILGRGLAVKEPATGTTANALFTGVPMNGAFTYPLANSNPVGGTDLGYNLTGNPYPSNIDLNLLYNLPGAPSDNNSININGTFYFWDNLANAAGTAQQGTGYNGSSYAIFNAVAGDTGTGLPAGTLSGTTLAAKTPTNVVKVGQGFMVKSAEQTNKKLYFDNTIRVGDGGKGFFGNTTKPVIVPVNDRYRLRFAARSNITTEVAVVYFDAGNNDFAKDDSQLNGLPSDILYTIIGDKKAVINGRSTFVNTDVIPLGSNHFTTGNYTISLGEKEGIFTNGQNIYLKDQQTGTVTNLSDGNYTFAANAGESTGRFEIVYVPETVLATEGSVKESLIVYRDGDDFVVKAQSRKITSLEVFDTTGRLILTLNPNSTKAIIPSEKMVNGVYVLKINQNGQITSKKIIR